MRQYPVWNQVYSCAYKQSNKGYGVNQTGNVHVYVGTSSRNSHSFIDHCVTHRELLNGDREYRFYVDGKCIKRALLKKGASQLKKLGIRDINRVRL